MGCKYFLCVCVHAFTELHEKDFVASNLMLDTLQLYGCLDVSMDAYVVVCENVCVCECV